MPTAPEATQRCLIIGAERAVPSVLYRRMLSAVREVGYNVDTVETGRGPIPNRELTHRVEGSDAIIYLMGSDDVVEFYLMGMAAAIGKLFVLLIQEGLSVDKLVDEFRVSQNLVRVIRFPTTHSGFLKALSKVRYVLQEFTRLPKRVGRPVIAPPENFVVNWDRLSGPDIDNLIRELLMQMGFRSVEWQQNAHFDLTATFIRKDPDGFEYEDLWLISTGKARRGRYLFEMIKDPEYLADVLTHEVFHGKFSEVGRDSDAPMTILFAGVSDEVRKMGENYSKRRTERRPLGRRGLHYRVRFWTRDYLASLVQQFPQIGYKYFSDEARAQSKFRKTPEQLYAENVALSDRLTLANNELETEKSLRTRFERDAAWKDISFTAAHKMGNPIFAIETSLDPLRKRIVEQRTSEAVQVLDRVRASVEKAKELVDDFKSLSKAQEIKPVPVKLRPLIEEACGMAKEHDVKCRITIPDDLCVIGDPIRLGECFDEIISNAVHWHSKGLTSIRVKAQQANSKSLPDSLEVSARYVTVIIQDNGPGVVTKNKSRIFDAFFTTRDQGTGLGLALVRRIIEGHGGTIVEDGIPDKGARFVLHIPLAMSTSGIALTARSERRPKRAKGK